MQIVNKCIKKLLFTDQNNARIMKELITDTGRESERISIKGIMRLICIKIGC